MRNLFLSLLLFISYYIIAEVPTTGLVSYYPFNGNANDTISSQPVGRFANITPTKDRFGISNSAYSFSGSNSYINLGINTAINGIIYDFTFSYWIYKTIAKEGCILASFSTQDESNWRLHIHSGISNVSFNFVPISKDNPWQSNTTLTNSILTNKWYNVTVVRKGSILTSYVNSTFASESTVSASKISSPTLPHPTTVLGKEFPSAPDVKYFNGILDDIRVYNRALDESEIASIYHERNYENDINRIDISECLTGIKISINSNFDTIHIIGFNNKARIIILDLNGRVVFSKNVNNDESVSINSLSQGIYILKLITIEKTVEQKIIKK